MTKTKKRLKKATGDVVMLTGLGVTSAVGAQAIGAIGAGSTGAAATTATSAAGGLAGFSSMMPTMGTVMGGGLALGLTKDMLDEVTPKKKKKKRK